MDTVAFLKQFEQNLKTVTDKLKDALRLIRSNRPPIDLIGDLQVNYFDQFFPIKQLGAIMVLPPRGIQITLWDKQSAGPVMKTIEEAHMGLTVSSDGNTIRATLSSLSDERREELAKLAKKEVEESRIKIRAIRDEAMKDLKVAQSDKKISEDVMFKSKEKAQKIVEQANASLDSALNAKLAEISE